MEAWEVAARESIREIVARYAHYADGGRFDELAALFTPGGVLEIAGGERIEGRAAIRDFLGGTRDDLSAATASSSAPSLIRHHVANLMLDVASPHEARGACYFLVLTGDGVDHWGRYRDAYVPDDPGEGWLFAHRLVRTEGRTPGGWADARLQA